MTTNANKFGLRKAAADRSRKHAQRTPLPPKPGVIEAAREVQASLVAGELTNDKSLGKARGFAEKAETAKWSVAVGQRGGNTEVTATRGSETIVQAWRNGVWQYDASVYAFGDRTTKPRNAAGALKLLARDAATAQQETAKVASNKHFRRAEPKDITTQLGDAQRSLPFDPELATDEEVMTVLKGQSIVWYNRISRGTESAIIGRGQSLRMTVNEENQRVVLWCCPVTGFRACLVTAILKVGRGRVANSESALVEVA
jgi:hypothetical protein